MKRASCRYEPPIGREDKTGRMTMETVEELAKRHLEKLIANLEGRGVLRSLEWRTAFRRTYSTPIRPEGVPAHRHRVGAPGRQLP